MVDTLFNFLENIGNMTEESWLYWPLTLSAYVSFIIGFSALCGGIGYFVKFIYKRNKYVLVAVLAIIFISLSLWLASVENTLARLENVAEIISFWGLIPLGVLIFLVAGADVLRRMIFDKNLSAVGDPKKSEIK